MILGLTRWIHRFGRKVRGRGHFESRSGPRSGACGAAVTVKFGHEREGDFTRQASFVADDCQRWGLPLMIEAMAKTKDMKATDARGVMLAARAAQEIGADIVKTYYTAIPTASTRWWKAVPFPSLYSAEKNPTRWRPSSATCTTRSRRERKGLPSAATSGSTG